MFSDKHFLIAGVVFIFDLQRISMHVHITEIADSIGYNSTTTKKKEIKKQCAGWDHY